MALSTLAHTLAHLAKLLEDPKLGIIERGGLRQAARIVSMRITSELFYLA